jgi:hypothetical protein
MELQSISCVVIGQQAGAGLVKKSRYGIEEEGSYHIIF